MGETRSRQRGTASFSTAPSLLIVLLLAVAAAGIRCSSSDNSLSNKSSSSPSPSPSAGDGGARVWAAIGQTLLQIDATTHQQGTVLPLSSAPVDLVLDPADRGLWVLGAQHLTKLDADGNRRFERKLADLAPGLDAARHVALDGHDSSAWVAAGAVLLHIDADGSLLGQWSAEAHIQALVLDLDESVWVLSENELVHLSPEAAVLARFLLTDLHDWGQARPTHIALDPFGSKLWLASDTKIVQLDTTNPAAGKAVSLPANGVIRGVSLDVFSGVLWALAGREILRIDRDLQLLPAVDLGALNFQDPSVLAFDPASRGFWVASGSAVTHLSNQGEVLGRVALVNVGGLLKVIIGVETLVVIPSLALVEPAPDAVTRNATPTFHLSLGASCNRQPCDLGDAYKESLIVSAELNAQSITPLLPRAGTEVTYTPATPLPDGVSTLTARAIDAFGHASEELAAGITIDTVPPAFVGLTPADGTRFEAREALIEGAVDDPRASVILMDAGNNVLSVGSTPFAFRVSLAAGVNTFGLIARDAAGNETRVMLNLFQGSSEIDITSHPDGTTVEGDGIILSGTFDGPTNTGITVNGMVAQVFGNRFFATVPLVPGSNTLTIVMTRPDGTRVTRTLTVNSTSSGTRPIEVRAQPASGIAPFKVTFTVTNNSDKKLKKLEIDFDGDGEKDLETLDVGQGIERTYASPGVYIAQLTITDEQETKHVRKLAIAVFDPFQADQLFESIWGGMNGALIRGDIQAAAAFLNAGAQRKYKPVFQALLPHMTEIIGSYSPLQRVSVSGEIAEYAIKRLIDGQDRIFLIYFLRGADGVWRLDAM